MVQKRPFVDEEPFEVSAKNQRQLELNNELVPYLKFVRSDPALQKPLSSGNCCFTIDTNKGVETLPYDELPVCIEDNETIVPGSLSISSWITSSTCKDDVRSEAAVHAPFLPDYFCLDHPIRTAACSEDIYSLLPAHPPRKAVPIGKDHQANMPTWNPHGDANSSNHSDSELALGNDDDQKLVGTCIIPMPDSATFVLNANSIGTGKTECSCLDNGSVRCIRQHITEVREKLRTTLGEERFLELGFGDMGEVVAEKWSDDEEQLFHEVVFSNPASVGKNFWDNLSIVFPSRNKKDIVSYYFNVFMLRRRAEQNRCDPMNIDSDNDEWHGNDDYSEGELSKREDDEDSVVESPVYEVNPGYELGLEVACGYDEDVINETCCNNQRVVSDGAKGFANVPEACTWKPVDSFGSNLAFQLSEETFQRGTDDHDIQDDSCTSSDTGSATQALRTNAESSENSDHWPSSFNSLRSGEGHGYVLDPCDAKVWGTGYMTCPKNEFDFLPTCTMIKEVFGDGDWDHKARDKKDFF